LGVFGHEFAPAYTQDRSQCHVCTQYCLKEATAETEIILGRCTTAQSDIETVKRFESVGQRSRSETNARVILRDPEVEVHFQLPCDQCRRKSLTCTCTRKGYVDPYEGFRVEKEQNRQPSETACERLGRHDVADLPPDAPQAILDEATVCGWPDVVQGDVSYRLSQQTGFQLEPPEPPIFRRPRTQEWRYRGW